MRSFSEVTLLGHITADPQGKIGDSTLSTVSIAINASYKNKLGEAKEDVNFFEVAFWGNTATNSLKLLKKGDYVMIKGSLKNSSWNDKDGIKKTKIQIVGNSFYLLSQKKNDINKYEKNITDNSDLDFSSVGDEI